MNGKNHTIKGTADGFDKEKQQRSPQVIVGGIQLSLN